MNTFLSKRVTIREQSGTTAVAAYHYQDIRYWNQIFCFNTNKFYKNANMDYEIFNYTDKITDYYAKANLVTLSGKKKVARG